MSAWCGIAGTGRSCCLPLISQKDRKQKKKTKKKEKVSSCRTVIKMSVGARLADFEFVADRVGDF